MLIFLLLKFLDEKLNGSKKYFRMDSNLGFPQCWNQWDLWPNNSFL